MEAKECGAGELRDEQAALRQVAKGIRRAPGQSNGVLPTLTRLWSGWAHGRVVEAHERVLEWQLEEEEQSVLELFNRCPTSFPSFPSAYAPAGAYHSFPPLLPTLHEDECCGEQHTARLHRYPRSGRRDLPPAPIRHCSTGTRSQESATHLWYSWRTQLGSVHGLVEG